MGTVILCLPRKDRFSTLLEFYFQRTKIETEVVTSRADFFRSLVPSEVSLVILDALMPEWSQISELLKCDRQTSGIPLVVLFPKGHKPGNAEEFIVLGDEHLEEPFEVGSLLKISMSLLESRRNGNAVVQQVAFHLSTVETHLDRANELVGQLLKGAGISEGEEGMLQEAFREALGNAAQHGNLYQADKFIKVLFRLEKKRIVIVVTDQGRGFDHQKFLEHARNDDPLSKARERYQEGRMGGLGIIIMNRSLDELRYNEQGNEITLIKNLPVK